MGQRDRNERDGAGGTVLLILGTVLFALPLVLMVLASLRQPGLAPPRGIELIPDRPSLRAYSDAFTCCSPHAVNCLLSCMSCA